MSGERLLVIDDVPANVKLLGAALEGDYAIQVATSGERGLDLARRSPPDLILLDVMMPGLDGFAACRRLKADPRLRDIPVIFVTARSEAEAETEGLEAGAADYLTKPINIAIARLRIRNLLERERMRKQLEQQEAQLEALVESRTAELRQVIAELESFLYSSSHDLTTPLRAINGYASIVIENEAARLSAEGRDLLERIARGAIRLSELIDDISTFARLSRQPMRPAEVALGDLVAEILSEVGTDYPATTVEVGTLPRVVGDAELLRHVLRRLIDNAFKYSSKAASPRVCIGSCGSGEAAAICVKDNGAGFDMAYADKLFGMFQRLHKEAEFPGRGADLAIVKRLVERHHGRVWAESRAGEGSSFYFTLSSN